jgi:NTP pyrophosphatase (non-canonical NTP hydrolase)
MFLSFQKRVVEWALHCFGMRHVYDPTISTLRFLEEALELSQACGLSKEEAMRVLDYVYARPQGTIKQEVGGVMVTLAVLCEVRYDDMQVCGEVELERAIIKTAEIRVRDRSKPDFTMKRLPDYIPVDALPGDKTCR